MHQWFKSNGHFTEGVDFAYWWSFSGGGSAINVATPSISRFFRNIFWKKLILWDVQIHLVNIYRSYNFFEEFSDPEQFLFS